MEPELSSPPESGEILAFFVRRDTVCGECGEELARGSMITLDRNKGALCLGCADLDHLEFLPRGDTALTRRASKHSRLKAIVLEWSRSRKRYERQGILAEPTAIHQAEAECLSDEDRRRRQAERRAVREAELDKNFVRDFARAISQHYPGCPTSEATRIAEHACRKYSGRVGRSAEAKRFDSEAVRLAVTAAVRHRFTKYDEFLQGGMQRYDARAAVSDSVDRKLREWTKPASHTNL